MQRERDEWGLGRERREFDIEQRCVVLICCRATFDRRRYSFGNIQAKSRRTGTHSGNKVRACDHSLGHSVPTFLHLDHDNCCGRKVKSSALELIYSLQSRFLCL